MECVGTLHVFWNFLTCPYKTILLLLYTLWHRVMISLSNAHVQVNGSDVTCLQRVKPRLKSYGLVSVGLFTKTPTLTADRIHNLPTTQPQEDSANKDKKIIWDNTNKNQRKSCKMPNKISQVAKARSPKHIQWTVIQVFTSEQTELAFFARTVGWLCNCFSIIWMVLYNAYFKTS